MPLRIRTIKNVEDARKQLQRIANSVNSGAITATDVTFTPTGNVSATTVQGAIAEVDSEKSIVGHTHSGSPESKLVQANTHESPDTDVADASLHHTLGVARYTASAGDHVHFTGVKDASKFAVTYSASSRKFTLVISSGAEYWIGNVRYNPTAATVETTAHADTTGVYWMYYSGSTLTAGTTPDFSAACPLAYVYFVSHVTTPRYVLFDERHPNTWPSTVWRHLHQTKGAQLISGGTIGNYTLDSNTDTPFSISETVIDDESYRHTLTALADGGPYTIWYRSGTDASNTWSWDLTPTVPYLDDGDDPYWNQLSGGSWTNVAASVANRWVNYWLCATNAYNDAGDNYKHRFILIMGQALHTTASSAQAEDFLTGISWGVLPFAELVPLYKISLRHVNDAGNKDAQIDFVTRIVGTNISALSTVSPTNHNSLSGRSDTGSHPATSISFTPAGGIAAETVQAAIEELDSEKSATGHTHAGSSISTYSVAFTDGDTIKRVTITDAGVAAASKIVATVRRPDSEDASDKGYLYLLNVVKIASGSFDVLITALDWGVGDCADDPPNETIVVEYMVA